MDEKRKRAFQRLIVFVALIFCVPMNYGLPCIAAQKRLLPAKWEFSPSFSPDGRNVYVLSKEKQKDGKGYILNSSDFSVISSVDGGLVSEWSFDSKFFATDTEMPPRVAIYAANGGKRLQCGIGYRQQYVWSPIDYRLLCRDENGISIASILPGGSAIIKCQNATNEINWDYPVWSPDGTMVAACASSASEITWYTSIRIWNSKNGQLLKKLDIKPSMRVRSIGAISWTPDGKQFVYTEPGILHVVSSDTMTEVQSFKTENIDAVRFKFSRDGGQIAYDDCQFIRICDLHGMRLISTIPVWEGVWFDWSPDGNYVLATDSNAMAVFDVRSTRCLGYTKVRVGAVTQWEPNGKSIIETGFFTPRYIALNLPPQKTKESIFKGGAVGSPDWQYRLRPKTLEQCYEIFDKRLTPEQLNRFKNTKESELSRYGGGSFVWDNLMGAVYGKWGFNELDKYFQDRGVTDGRGVVGIIIRSYWRHLHAIPVDLEGQIKKEREYWARENCQTLIARLFARGIGSIKDIAEASPNDIDSWEK